MCLPKESIGGDQSGNRHVYAGADGLTLDFDRLVACHRQLRAAEKSLLRIFDDVAQEVRDDSRGEALLEPLTELGQVA
jgi:hypothetical protein